MTIAPEQVGSKPKHLDKRALHTRFKFAQPVHDYTNMPY